MPPPSNLSKDAFPCIKCSQHFSTKFEQASHFEGWEGFENPWICHQCPTYCPTEEALRAHVNAIHGRSVLDKFGKGGHYCNAAKDCGPPFGEKELLNQHIKHDHVNQRLRSRKMEHRGCPEKGCEFTNDSYVGLSLHHLHYHSPKCGCGLMFWKVTELIKHRETCAEGQQKMEEALTKSTKRKSVFSNQFLQISKRPRQINLVPTSVETVYVTPPSSTTESTTSTQNKPNSGFMSRLALPGQPKPTTHTISSSTPSSSSEDQGTPNMTATEFAASTLPLAAKNHPASTSVPSPVVAGLGTATTPLMHSIASPAPVAGEPYSLVSTMPSPEMATTRTIHMPAGSFEPSSLSMAGETYLSSHSVPSSTALAPRVPSVAPLPVSIYQCGFKPDDFNPSTVYVSNQCSKARYIAFPDDLPDEHVFNAPPQHIAYGNLLNIAVRYSNADIHRQVNEGRPKAVLSSPQMVESRIRGAFSWAAEENWQGFTSVDAVRDWFTKERAKSRVSVKKSISLADYAKRSRQNAAPLPTTLMATQPIDRMAQSPYLSSGTLHSTVAQSSLLAGQKRARDGEEDGDSISAKKAMSLSDYTQRAAEHEGSIPQPSVVPPPGIMMTPYSYSSSATSHAPMVESASVTGQKRLREENDHNISAPSSTFGRNATVLPTASMIPQAGAMMAPYSYPSTGVPAQSTPLAGQKRGREEDNDSGVSAAPSTFEQSSRVIAPAHKKAKMMQ